MGVSDVQIRDGDESFPVLVYGAVPVRRLEAKPDIRIKPREPFAVLEFGLLFGQFLADKDCVFKTGAGRADKFVMKSVDLFSYSCLCARFHDWMEANQRSQNHSKLPT